MTLSSTPAPRLENPVQAEAFVSKPAPAWRTWTRRAFDLCLMSAAFVLVFSSTLVTVSLAQDWLGMDHDRSGQWAALQAVMGGGFVFACLVLIKWMVFPIHGVPEQRRRLQSMR